MAIRFNNSNLSGVEYNLYNIDKFNGVDYTTTPTLVDDSRAIEISNYLPKGNSLVKRNGVSMVLNNPKYRGRDLFIHDIWEDFLFKKNDAIKSSHLMFASERSEEGNLVNPRMYWVKSMFVPAKTVITSIYEFENYEYDLSNATPVKLDDLYSFGEQFEGRIFSLCMGEYLMTQLDGSGDLEIVPVSVNAYVPTVVIGLGAMDDNIKVSINEEINLLSNKCYIEIIKYNSFEEGSQFDKYYDIGQFFNEEFIISRVADEMQPDGLDENGVYVDGLGTFKWESHGAEDKKCLYFEHSLNDDDEMKDRYKDFDYVLIEITFTNRKKSKSIVNKMRFGVPYGSYGHRDRLFLSGNPDYPNMDVHSCETNDLANAWKDYTYFCDNSYAMIGSSDTAIKGYGFLNNGSMAVFKEGKTNTPNLFFRTYEMQQDAEGNYKEIFPITISGLSIDVPVNNQVIAYGNDLLINTPEGIYKILAGESTATQTYESVEMSYFIRENLGKNISNSCNIVFDGKLYISREDKDGNKRVYVADKNRYSFIEGKQVYEWFVIDGLDVEKFYIFDRILYFSNAKGIFKFNDFYEDEYHVTIENANINGEDFSSEAFVDEDNDQIILSTNNKEIQKIIESNDCANKWEKFKRNTKIKFNSDILIREFDYEFVEIVKDENYETTLKCKFYFEYDSENPNYLFPILLEEILINDVDVYRTQPYIVTWEGLAYSINKITFNDVGYVLDCTENAELDFYDISGGMYLGVNCEQQGFWFDINELYYLVKEEDGTIKQYPFSKCVLDEDIWYYTGEYNDEFVMLGNKKDVAFNNFDLKYRDYFIDFTSLGRKSFLRDVVFKFYAPVESYWRSKFNALGRLDYLKTIDMTTFVADAKLGGKTDVGYRTTFKKSNSKANQMLVIKEKENQTELIRKDLDFNEIDFSYFSFSTETFAQTYTTKKKIKNFSFMQLAFESNDSDNSTIVSLSLRYKYTRNNKGVR